MAMFGVAKKTAPALWSGWLQGLNPREGLPKLREQWVARREARGDTCISQVLATHIRGR